MEGEIEEIAAPDGYSSVVEWRSWMEDLDHVRDPPRNWVRPAGLGSLGDGSYFIEPYRIRAPQKVFIGADVGIGERAMLSVVEGLDSSTSTSVLRIGDRCQFAPDLCVACAGDVEIADGVGMSARVFIGAPRGDLGDSDPSVARKSTAVRIGAGAALGLGSIIMAGVTIGERAVISSGSVVMSDVAPRTVVFGNPARVVRSWDEEVGRWRIGG